MESLIGPDFETEGFKEIFEYRDSFLYSIHEIFKLAVGAVKKVLHRDAAPGVNLDVDSHHLLPTEPCPNQEELLPAPNQPIDDVVSIPVLKSPAVISQIPVAKVIFNEAYKVEILDGDIGNPTWFWLKLIGSSSQRMEEELEEAYKFQPKIEELPSLGTFVVCKSDNKFYRAKVVTIAELQPRESSSVCVVLVDYGQIKTVYLFDLYPIESRFCTEPAIGLLCSLKDIKPFRGDVWELGSIILFNKQCRGDLTVVFQSPTEELTETFSKFKPDFWVSLYKNEAQENMMRDVRSILIKEGLGKDDSSDPALQLPVSSSRDAPFPPFPMSASSNQLISPAESALQSSVVVGEVYSILKKPSSPPQTIPGTRNTSAQLNEETESVPLLHLPVDRLLMDRFFQSLGCRSTTNSVKSVGSDGLSRMSFVSADTHISKHSEPSFDGSDRKRSVRIHLDYQYGKELERRPLPTSTKLTVQLSYVFHPNHFYVHIKDEVPTLVEPLVKRLNELYRHSKPVPVQLPEIGSFWVVKEKTMNNWARVLVVEVNVVKGICTKVTVLSVDWGFVVVVELSQLRPLVHQVSETPCLALCFRLAGVYPLNQSMDSEDWPKEAIETFIKWATSEDDFLALIEDRDQRDGQWSVLMFKGLKENEMTLNELLVNLKLASSTIFPLGVRGAAQDVIKPKNENEQELLLDQDFPDWDPMREDYDFYMKTTAIDMENNASAVASDISEDDEEMYRFDPNHIQPNRDPTTQDKMKVYIDLPAPVLPIPGSTILLLMTSVSRSYRFYCVLKHDIFSTVVNKDSSETLETLQAAIQKEYNENHQLHRVTLNPSAGDIVIARSPNDKKWYRGRVMEELEKEEFAVFFVDSGEKWPVPMKDVCLPLERFTHLPMQAVEMFLNGIDRDSDTIEARDELLNLVKGKDLLANVIHDTPVLLVDLYDLSGLKRVDLAEELIRRGVVQRGLYHKLFLSSRGDFIAG